MSTRQTSRLNAARHGDYVLKIVMRYRAADDVNAREIARGYLDDMEVFKGGDSTEVVLRVHGRPERGNLFSAAELEKLTKRQDRCSVVGQIDPDKLKGRTHEPGPTDQD